MQMVNILMKYNQIEETNNLHIIIQSLLPSYMLYLGWKQVIDDADNYTCCNVWKNARVCECNQSNKMEWVENHRYRRRL